MSIGSSGKGDERYLLYIPFTFSPGRELSNIDVDKKYNAGGCEIGFEKNQYYYALTIGHFQTEEQAKLYYPKIKSALLWISLKYLIGISTPAELTPVSIMGASTPVPVKGPIKEVAEVVGWNTTEGHYDADKSVVRPDHKKLIRWEMGRPTVTAGLGANNFIESIKEALNFPNPENIQIDSKLQLAIELYSSFFFEQSHEAKFIKLVTVLEALIPDYLAEEPAKSLSHEINDLIKQKRNEYSKESDDWKELNLLLCRAGQLKYQSIGRSLRTYISGIIEENPTLGQNEEVTNKLKDLYNIRSKLLHEGIGDNDEIKNGLSFLNTFVPKLLETLYRKDAA